jgi:hypothetical protein
VEEGDRIVAPPPDAAPLMKKLEGYANLKGKADAEDEVQALQEINVLALSLKKKLARHQGRRASRQDGQGRPGRQEAS